MKRRKLVAADAAETLSGGYEMFCRHCTIKNLSPATLLFYKNCYDEFVRYAGDGITCSEINSSLIEEYQLHLKSKDLAEASVNSYLKGLRAILYWFMKRNMVAPFTIQLMKQSEVIKETFTDEEMKALLVKPKLKGCDFSTYRNWVMVNFLLGTGVRISTLISIQVQDLELAESCFKVRHNKNRKAQIIPLPSSLVKVLTEYLEYRQHKSPESLLFVNTYGDSLTVGGARQALKKYGQRRNVENCNPHKFRHTFAKNWVLANGDVFRLQKILGHSSMDIVRKYVNLYGKDLSRDFDKFSVLERFSAEKKSIIMNN